MGAIASQITSLTIVYSNVYLDADQRKHQSSATLAFCAGNSPVTGEFPAQRASNAENVSIWWRHHDSFIISEVLWHSSEGDFTGNAQDGPLCVFENYSFKIIAEDW